MGAKHEAWAVVVAVYFYDEVACVATVFALFVCFVGDDTGLGDAYLDQAILEVIRDVGFF